MRCPHCGKEIPEYDDDEERTKQKLPSTVGTLARGCG